MFFTYITPFEKLKKILYSSKYLSMCFVTSEPRRHAEDRNVCTLNEGGLIYIVYSDICLLSYSTNIKTLLTMQWRQTFVAEFDDNKVIKTTHPNPFVC